MKYALSWEIVRFSVWIDMRIMRNWLSDLCCILSECYDTMAQCFESKKGFEK